MKAIGGYFELELPKSEEYHKEAIRLNTGRNAFEYILRARNYEEIYLPYYTCDVMLEPIEKLNLKVHFYSIDENFGPVFDFSILKSSDAFVYTNYFGICDKQVLEVSKKCINLIIDNSQAFYANPLPKVDTFYSPRKFFGIPDGAYLYTNVLLNTNFGQDVSISRIEHLTGRIEKEAEAYYKIFQENDNLLSGQPIKKMSNFTKRILESIDYKVAAKKRLKNFLFLHDFLKNQNELKFEIKNDMIPMVYPFLSKEGNKLKKILLQNKIFTATYWPNVTSQVSLESLEYNFTQNIIFLPIDQRYSENDIASFLEFLY